MKSASVTGKRVGRGVLGVLVVCVASGVLGCRLTGTWKVTEFSPPPVGAHLDTITFSVDGRYTATDVGGGPGATSTGPYSWTGFSLRLSDADGGVRSYPCLLRLDLRSLRISNYRSDDPWKAVLRRSD